MGSLTKMSSYKYLAGVPQGSVFGPTLLLLYIDNLPDDVICNIAICADDTTLCSEFDQVSVATETLDWGRKWLADFNAMKTQLGTFG